MEDSFGWNCSRADGGCRRFVERSLGSGELLVLLSTQKNQQGCLFARKGYFVLGRADVVNFEKDDLF